MNVLDNQIRGGQIFIHNIRMFKQVALYALFLSFLLGVLITFYLNIGIFDKIDPHPGLTYWKGYMIDKLDDMVPGRSGKQMDINIARNLMNPVLIPIKQFMQDGYFIRHGIELQNIIFKCLFQLAWISSGLFILIFGIWGRFGRFAKKTEIISGSKIHNAKEVTSYLRKNKRDSFLKAGDMPLVKDSETKHILITGATGSGKTNLINNLLPQIIIHKMPALVIDNTGEMIARYYNKARGDIIFNPLDSRSHAWDFWKDNSPINGPINADYSNLEKFAKVLFKYGKKQSAADPFWDNSSEAVFCSCVQYLIETGKEDMGQLQRMLQIMTLDELRIILKGTKAIRYLNSNNKVTAGSILSVLASNTKPLNLLKDGNKKLDGSNKFSLIDYFKGVENGSDAWLFLSSPPDLRQVVLPLLACMFELAVSCLIGLKPDLKRRMWFVVDELSSLGRLNGFATLIQEGRKYGGCILSATQSINQLFENFGNYGGNVIFGQFATKFLFRTDEPLTTRIISEMFGNIEYSQQQKNTSYGANEFRDGISYTEQQRQKSLVTSDMLASLPDLECFVSLPEPEVRIARVKVPLNIVPEVNPGFVRDIRSNADIRGDVESDIDITQAAQKEQKIEESDNKESNTTNRSFILTQGKAKENLDKDMYNINFN